MKLEFHGKNITVRKLKLSDAGDIYRHIRKKDIVKWTSNIPHPYPKGSAVRFIRGSHFNIRKKKAYNLGIALNQTGKIIGGIGIRNIDREKKKSAELGYWLGKEYWNRGYVTEAVKLMLEFAFRTLKLHRIYAEAFKNNHASNKVLQKAGFKKEGELREAEYRHGEWQDVCIYSILTTEF